MENYGLNGLGQIGREVFRRNVRREMVERLPIRVINEWEDPDKVVADLGDILPAGVRLERDPSGVQIISPDGSQEHVAIVQWKEAQQVAWGDHGVTSVIDASRNPEITAPWHEAAGVKEVLLTGPSAGCPEIIRGINEHVITADQRIYSNASCTTKAGAPVVKKILGAVQTGQLPPVTDIFLTGTHAATNTDSTVDRLGLKGVIDNMIAATTGAAKALPRVFPALAEKLKGSVDRVGITDGSRLNVHFVFEGPIANTREAAHRKIHEILLTMQPTDPTIFGVDVRKEPDVKTFRDDLRPSVYLPSVLQVGERGAVIPVRYLNVAASANEALVTIRLIREMRVRLAASGVA